MCVALGEFHEPFRFSAAATLAARGSYVAALSFGTCLGCFSFGIHLILKLSFVVLNAFFD